MSIGYDPFYWYEREIDREFMENYGGTENMENKIEIDLDAITKRRDELTDLKARYSFELKQVEKEIETLDLQLIALLNQMGTDEMTYKTFTFGWKTTQRTAFDQKLFGEQYPDLLSQFKVTKENRVFNFKINK